MTWITNLICFFCGCFVGSGVVMFAVALAYISKEADRQNNKDVKEGTEGKNEHDV